MDPINAYVKDSKFAALRCVLQSMFKTLIIVLLSWWWWQGFLYYLYYAFFITLVIISLVFSIVHTQYKSNKNQQKINSLHISSLVTFFRLQEVRLLGMRAVSCISILPCASFSQCLVALFVVVYFIVYRYNSRAVLWLVIVVIN